MSEQPSLGKWLNLDVIISEEDKIMRENFDKKDKDPNAFLNFATAQNIKILLLKKYAEQENNELHGHWETNKNGEEVCSICWIPRKKCEFNGKCVICGAKMEGGHDHR